MKVIWVVYLNMKQRWFTNYKAILIPILYFLFDVFTMDGISKHFLLMYREVFFVLFCFKCDVA